MSAARRIGTQPPPIGLVTRADRPVAFLQEMVGDQRPAGLVIRADRVDALLGLPMITVGTPQLTDGRRIFRRQHAIEPRAS